MKILELDLPSFVSPITPYRIDGINAVIFSSKVELPKGKYFGPRRALKVILYGDEWTNETINKFILDFIKFKNFLFQDYTLYKWLNDNPTNHLKDSMVEIDNLDDYVAETSADEALMEKELLFQYIDFDEYPIEQIVRKPYTINFSEGFSLYFNLDIEIKKRKKVKELIEFFAFISNSIPLTNSWYNNINFQISSTFSIIEALISLRDVNQQGIVSCEKCGEQYPAKRKMKEIISDYIESRNLREEDKPVFVEVLSKHYKVRNKFFHNVRLDTLTEMLKGLEDKTGERTISLDYEISHMNAGLNGLHSVNNLIRFELLDLLSGDGTIEVRN